MPAAQPSPTPSLSRRRLLGGALGLAAGAATAQRLTGGVFVAGDERIRIGLVGCGGRGTGAAVQAAASAAAVRIVAIGDLFADQVTTAATILDREAGHRFACPAAARFVGADAWRRVIDAEVDLVILATPPDERPRQLATAVAAGRHVFCETPAAIDFSGAEMVAAACAAAHDRGLSLMSGLAWRRDRDTAALVGRLHDGVIGRLHGARMVAHVGLPWQRPAAAGWAAVECRRRNWIASPEQSGGDIVERQIHSIDKALWAFGDEDPLLVEPIVPAASGTTAIRFLFAAGRRLIVAGSRGQRTTDVISEVVHGDRGCCDLRRPADGENAGQRPGAGRHRAAVAALIRSLLAGDRVDDGGILRRATSATLLARAAATAGATIPWPTVPRGSLPLLRPV